MHTLITSRRSAVSLSTDTTVSTDALVEMTKETLTHVLNDTIQYSSQFNKDGKFKG